jgi:hypothetical protein
MPSAAALSVEADQQAAGLTDAQSSPTDRQTDSMSAAAGNRRPTVSFSPEALASWARICKQEVLEAVHKRDSWYYEFERHVAAPGPDGLPYEQVRETKEPMFVGYATKASTIHSLAHLSAPVSLAAMAHGSVGIESSYHQRAMFAHMYGDNFVDGGILQIAERPTSEDPFHFVGVTYSAFKQPVIRAREYVFFEHSGSVEDADGRLVVFKVARSMPADDVNLDRVKSSGAQLVLGEMNITFLMRSSHGGARTDMKVQGMLRLETKMPNWATSTLVQPYFDGMENLGSVGASRALQDRIRGLTLDSPKLLKKKRSAPGMATAACRVCLRRRRAMASMRVCIGCEREVCKSCTKKLQFVSSKTHETVWVRFCKLCVAEAQSAGCELDGVSTSSGSSVSGSTDRDDVESLSSSTRGLSLGF